MMKRALMVSALATVVSLPSGFAWAADQERAETQTQTQTRTEMQEQVYGSQLMTQQERLQYHERMRAAKNEQERLRIRNEHHKAMQERARERGLTLPDQPPAVGGGMGPGGGMGSGGGGMGPGGGGGGRR